jgi:hypothetical protein
LLSFRLGLDRPEAADNTDYSADLNVRVTRQDVTCVTFEAGRLEAPVSRSPSGVSLR